MKILDEKMLNINELYPTKSLVHITPERIQKLLGLLKKDGSDTEIIAFIYNKHYYIVDGHAQLMAAAYLGAKQVHVYIVNYKELPFYSEDEDIESLLAGIGISTVYDFEGICGFKYLEYPEYYRGN